MFNKRQFKSRLRFISLKGQKLKDLFFIFYTDLTKNIIKRNFSITQFKKKFES